jgi:glycosyltransferase involved in cell wall biosynthesis
VHLSTVAAVPPPEFPGDPLSAEVGSCRNLLYFGVIRQYKGLDELIEAFSALPRPVAERLVLTIVGETWEGHTAPLERLAASPHRDRVRLVNRYVTDAEAAHVFAEADVVVLPYRRASASGPLHIAMAEGLPVIVSDVPALVAAIGTYEGAELVPVGDVAALSGAVARAADRPRRRFAPSGDWRRTVEAYQALVSDREPAGSGDVAVAISPLEITSSAQ